MNFDKADEAIAAAHLCHHHGLPNSAVSRAYYAAFHAAVAALEAAGIASASEGWSHSGLQAAFARELIHRRKVYRSHNAHVLADLLSWRIAADYETPGVSARTATRALAHAEEFLTMVKGVVG